MAVTVAGTIAGDRLRGGTIRLRGTTMGGGRLRTGTARPVGTTGTATLLHLRVTTFPLVEDIEIIARLLACAVRCTTIIRVARRPGGTAICLPHLARNL